MSVLSARKRRDWRGKLKTRNEKRRALRRELVHAAGCVFSDMGPGCMVVERFREDERWPREARDLGVSVPRSLRGLCERMDRTA